MEALTLTEPALRSEVEQGPQAAKNFPTLARFLAKVYDDHVAPHEAKRALFEPRRVATPSVSMASTR